MLTGIKFWLSKLLVAIAVIVSAIITILTIWALVSAIEHIKTKISEFKNALKGGKK